MSDLSSKILSGDPQAIQEYWRRTDELVTAAAMRLNEPYTGDGIEYLDRALPFLASYNEHGWEDLPEIDGANSMSVSWMARDVLTKRFAWAVPDETALEMIAKLSPIVEVGAGSGYWAKELRRYGAKVAPYDRSPYPLFNGQISYSHAAVAKGDPQKALRDHPERTLFLCWPSYNLNWAAQAVRLHRGEFVAYVGEGDGGCTGDSDLHVTLSILYEEIASYQIPRWWGLRDWLTIYRRKAELTDETRAEIEIELGARATYWDDDD